MPNEHHPLCKLAYMFLPHCLILCATLSTAWDARRQWQPHVAAVSNHSPRVAAEAATVAAIKACAPPKLGVKVSHASAKLKGQSCKRAFYCCTCVLVCTVSALVVVSRCWCKCVTHRCKNMKSKHGGEYVQAHWCPSVLRSLMLLLCWLMLV